MTGSDMNTQGSPILRPAPTPKEELDSALVSLSANSQGWVDLAIEERIKLVETIHQGFPAIWDRWESISVKAKGIDDRKYGNDRDWLALAMISRIHTVVLRSLRDIGFYGNNCRSAPGTWHWSGSSQSATSSKLQTSQSTRKSRSGIGGWECIGASGFRYISQVVP